MGDVPKEDPQEGKHVQAGLVTCCHDPHPTPKGGTVLHDAWKPLKQAPPNCPFCVHPPSKPLALSRAPLHRSSCYHRS